MSTGDLRNLAIAREAAERGLAACDRADALLDALLLKLRAMVQS